MKKSRKVTETDKENENEDEDKDEQGEAGGAAVAGEF